MGNLDLLLSFHNNLEIENGFTKLDSNIFYFNLKKTQYTLGLRNKHNIIDVCFGIQS